MEIKFYSEMPNPLPEKLPAGVRFEAVGSCPMVFAGEATLYDGCYNGPCRATRLGASSYVYRSSLACAADIDWPSVPLPAQAVEACCCCGQSGPGIVLCRATSGLVMDRPSAQGMWLCDVCNPVDYGDGHAHERRVAAFDARQRLLAEQAGKQKGSGTGDTPPRDSGVAPAAPGYGAPSGAKTCATCTSPATVGSRCVYCATRELHGRDMMRIKMGLRASEGSARLLAGLASEKPRVRRGKWQSELAKKHPWSGDDE